MRYVIVYLLRGKIKEYHKKLVREIGPKFGERYLIENPLPPHITLRSPFDFSNPRRLENIIEEFAKSQKKSRIKIKDFGHFRKDVSFLKVDISKDSRTTQRELVKTLEGEGIKPNKFDLKYHPHITISYSNSQDTFSLIWNSLSKLEKPNFDLEFDNITILRKPKKFWEVYKVYELN